MVGGGGRWNSVRVGEWLGGVVQGRRVLEIPWEEEIQL